MSRELPNVAEVLGPVLGRVPPEQRPLLMAIAEQMAAERYRGWAEAAPDPARQTGFLACAEREEKIAGLVAALYPDAAAIQATIRAANPDLEDLNRSVFADRPLADQLAIQAQGERVGASTWRAMAEDAEPATRQTFLDCAVLEEQSAAVLESILADGA